MPFEEQHQKLIKRNLEKLSKNTTEFETLATKLFQFDIISEDELMTWIAKGESGDLFKRNLQFYMLLVKKNSEGFDVLLEALRATGQTELSNLLECSNPTTKDSKEKDSFQAKSSNSTDKSNNKTLLAPDHESNEDDDDDEFTIANSISIENTPENMQNLLQAFREYDTSGDGKISYDEFFKLMSRFGWSKKTSQKILKTNDANGDGQLDKFEFLNIFFKSSVDSCVSQDFILKGSMKSKIISILEDDPLVQQRWDRIFEEIVQPRYRHDIQTNSKMFHEKISKSLDCWMSSNETSETTFKTLVGIIRNQSVRAAENLENNKEIIKSA